MTPEERARRIRMVLEDFASSVMQEGSFPNHADIVVAEHDLDPLIADAVAEEREACARLMCGFCSHGRPLVAPTAFITEWQHELKLPDTPAWNVPCKAQSIRARAVSR